ncbi:MAG: MFS transporter [Planctomycetota bacterium]|nr:MFS transporter [Planctomycetota bacterium]
MSDKRTSLGVIFLTLFIDLIGFSILFPLVAAIMSHFSAEPGGLLGTWYGWLDAYFPNASPIQREALFGGILMGLYSVLQFVCAPAWGILSDKIGRRPVLIVTILGNTAGYVLWAFADSFALLLLSRVVCGLFSGNISVATAAVADVTDTKNRAKGMGFVGMAFGFGFILGPAIGGTCYALLPHFGGDVASGGWALNPFSVAAAIAGGLSLLNLLWVVMRFRETRRGDQTSEVPVRAINPLRIFSRDNGTTVRAVVVANLLFGILFAGLEATLVFLVAEKLGYQPGDMAWLFVVLGLTSALVQGGIVRRMAPKHGERKLALVGLGLMIPAFALLGCVAWVQSAWLLYLGVLVLGFGTGFAMPCLAALASLGADESNQGRALGSFRSSGALSRALGPFIGAGLYFAIGPAAPYLAGSALLIVPMLIIARIHVRGARAEGAS